MKVLLDTHTLLWMLLPDPRMSIRAKSTILDPDTELLVSSVSVWEIAIKYSQKRLELRYPPEEFLPAQFQQNAISVLPITLPHAVRVASMPFHHKDPFDRLLIAQAQVEQIPILTADPQFSKYDVEVIW